MGKTILIPKQLDFLELAQKEKSIRVIEFTETPRMLVPFNKKEMEDFFLKLAESLEKEIFE